MASKKVVIGTSISVIIVAIIITISLIIANANGAFGGISTTPYFTNSIFKLKKSDNSKVFNKNSSFYIYVEEEPKNLEYNISFKDDNFYYYILFKNTNINISSLDIGREIRNQTTSHLYTGILEINNHKYDYHILKSFEICKISIDYGNYCQSIFELDDYILN